jgi:hypothetical protein
MQRIIHRDLRLVNILRNGAGAQKAATLMPEEALESEKHCNRKRLFLAFADASTVRWHFKSHLRKNQGKI